MQRSLAQDFTVGIIIVCLALFMAGLIYIVAEAFTASPERSVFVSAGLLAALLTLPAGAYLIGARRSSTTSTFGFSGRTRGSLEVNGNPKILPSSVVAAMQIKFNGWFVDPEMMIEAH